MGDVKLNWQHSADRKSVRITFPDQDYSAEDLSALVAGIATIREQTEPPIPNDPDLLHAVQAILDPRWYLARDAMNEVIALGIRVPGIGWIPFAIPVAEATHLRDLLTEQLEHPNAAPGAAH